MDSGSCSAGRELYGENSAGDKKPEDLKKAEEEKE